MNKNSVIVVAGDTDEYSLWASLLVFGLQCTDDQMSRYGRGCSRERDDPDDVGRDGVEANEDTEDESDDDTGNESDDDTESDTGIKK